MFSRKQRFVFFCNIVIVGTIALDKELEQKVSRLQLLLSEAHLFFALTDARIKLQIAFRTRTFFGQFHIPTARPTSESQCADSVWDAHQVCNPRAQPHQRKGLLMTSLTVVLALLHSRSIDWSGGGLEQRRNHLRDALNRLSEHEPTTQQRTSQD